MFPRMTRPTVQPKGCLPCAWISALLAIALLIAMPLRVNAKDGDLDPTFGQGGKLTTEFDGSEGARAIAAQADSKLIAIGDADSSASFSHDFALVRYSPEGVLDLTFGDGGRVLTDFGYREQARALVIQNNGRILVAGDTQNPNDNSDFALARYHPDGTLDSEFGNSGKVTTSFVGDDYARAIVLQVDNRIVAAGSTYGSLTHSDFALARYRQDGTLDADFGDGGKVTTDFFGGHDDISALALQDDGKIVAAGAVVVEESGTRDFALTRYNPDGSLDAEFGEGGKVTTELNADDWARAVLVQADGKIVVGGYAGNQANGPLAFAIARYNSNGTLDTDFGLGGKVITSLGERAAIYALVEQWDGKIVAAGYTRNESPFVHDFALARYNADGSLDYEFGVGGKVTTDFGWEDTAFALAMQPNGRLVAAGYARDWESQAYAFALARYLTPLSNPTYLPLVNP